MIAITGTPRSGTSLMMQILQRMGCDIAGEKMPLKDRGEFAKERTQYLNPHGFFEDRIVMMGTDRPEDYSGKAVKILFPGIGLTPMSGIEKIILCVRDPREIAVSQTMLISQAEVVDKVGNHRYSGELTKIKPDRYILAMGTFLKWAYRNDVFWGKTHTVDYADIIERTVPTLKALCSFVGKGFTPVLADSIDLSLYRSSVESLQGFELAVKIYTAFKTRLIGVDLLEEIDAFMRSTALENIVWVSEFGFPVNGALYRSLVVNNNGVRDKLDPKHIKGSDFRQCEFFSQSDAEFYESMRPPDIGTKQVPKVLCQKDGLFKTLVGCFRCRSGA